MKIIVTTSWDDGNKLDLKLAELLDEYNLRGTFYVSPGSKRFSLSEEDIRKLSQKQEIGAHTVSHPHLTRLEEPEAKKEIFSSKDYLENLLGKEIKMFCYPYGEFNGMVKNLVKEAGFLGARTVDNSLIQFPKDFFELGTTLHVYPFSFWQTVRLFKWSRSAKSLFDRALRRGEIYHLWGHSWEIERYNMWQELEEVFKYISSRDNCLYLTNGEALTLLRNLLRNLVSQHTEKLSS